MPEIPIRAQDARGRTRLHRAALASDRPVAAFLLDKGAQVNATDQEGRTPLHLAIEAGDDGLVQLLVSRGADVNTKDRKGTTPLHQAVLFGRRNIAEFLLSKGARAAVPDNENRTPLHLAVLAGEPDLVALLQIGRRARGQHPPRDAAAVSRSEDVFLQGVKRALRQGHGVSALIEHGSAPRHTRLHLAAGFGYITAARFLISQGADVDAKDSVGWTPLHWAAWNGRKELVQLLVDHKAAVNTLAKGSRNETPLDIAIRHGQAEVAELLRSLGGKTTKETIQ